MQGCSQVSLAGKWLLSSPCFGFQDSVQKERRCERYPSDRHAGGAGQSGQGWTFLCNIINFPYQGQQDLKEVVEHWKQTNHIMAKWFPEDNRGEKPKDFISKFLSGQE